MALRVLLADESNAIKKVIQLALQDFGVEVKAVQVGLDVLEVARSFRPDIVFADVLLQRRSGYEVTADLKNDPGLAHIPVVLMWSSFMELDENSFNNSRANARLEKPFDLENLRSLVLDLVPKTQSQKISQYLDFPPNIADPVRVEERERKDKLKQMAKRGAQVDPVQARSQPQASHPGIQNQTSAAHLGAPLGTESHPQKSHSQMSAAKTPPSAPSKMPSTGSAKTPPAPPRGAQTPSVPQRPDAKAEASKNQERKSWSMESFQDIESFAEAEGLASHDPSDDEDFSRLKLNDLPQPKADSQRAIKSAARATPTAPQKPVTTTAETSEADDDEPWSTQDLSRFKLDLPPVNVESEELSVLIDLNKNEVEEVPREFASSRPKPIVKDHRGYQEPEEEIEFNVSDDAHDFSSPKTSHHDQADQTSDQEADTLNDHRQLDDDEEAVSFELDLGQGRDIATRETGSFASQFSELEPDFSAPVQTASPARGTSSAKIPELTVEQLEEIVRAQSISIIEGLVHKLVPEIATRLIQKELDRLLREEDGEISP